MSRIPLSHRIGFLLVILAVAGPLSAAPAHRSDPVRSEAGAPLAILWSWVTNIWAKNGCMIDPGGHCLPGTASTQPAATDNGCAIDPWGRCNSAAAADNGCGIDPHGSCHPG